MTDPRVSRQGGPRASQRRINILPLLSYLLVGLLLAFVVYVFFDDPRDWINATDIGEVQAWATIAQAVLALALVLVTISTIQLTRQTADASAKAADIQARGLLDATLPVVVVKVGMWGGQHRLDSIELAFDNAGNGPALDVRAAFEGSKLNFMPPGLAEVPTAFARGDETVSVTIRLNLNDPFTDLVPNRPWWNEPQPNLSDPDAQAAALADWTRRHEGFNVQAYTLAQQLETVGTLVFSYRDIHRRSFETRVNLVVIEPFDRDLWPFVQISQMSFVRLEDSRSEY